MQWVSSTVLSLPLDPQSDLKGESRCGKVPKRCVLKSPEIVFCAMLSLNYNYNLHYNDHLECATSCFLPFICCHLVLPFRLARTRPKTLK